jgi:hypothetical protein
MDVVRAAGLLLYPLMYSYLRLCAFTVSRIKALLSSVYDLISVHPVLHVNYNDRSETNGPWKYRHVILLMTDPE